MTDAEADTPTLWPPDVKNQLVGKDPDAGKDWRQEERGMAEDEMVGWHHPQWWTWVWVVSGSWWWTGKPGVLQSMGSQRVGHNWATELNWDTHNDRISMLISFTLVCSNSCLLSWWCYLTIPSSVAPFSFCLPSSSASRCFPNSQLFASGGQSIGTSASATVLPMNIQDLLAV